VSTRVSFGWILHEAKMTIIVGNEFDWVMIIIKKPLIAGTEFYTLLFFFDVPTNFRINIEYLHA